MQSAMVQKMLTDVEKLNQPELEHFVSQVIAISARRKAPLLFRAESELLLKINRGLPAELQARLQELFVRRQAGTLSAGEHAELLKLNELVESMEGERIEYLTELAQLRGTTVPKLLKDLGIQALAHA